ncbi:biotin transporter BioY [Kineococcus sp. R8]|uniref:biotin transporter BioY n=1 Tax=Kineococcus siccus TaxID=2696567 RepID=UPI0014121578|nr:biotin transporter BioY [Kineococcus siccus]NAZ84096.1 biotin transporter BioY [Kineococcus siccus]
MATLPRRAGARSAAAPRDVPGAAGVRRPAGRSTDLALVAVFGALVGALALAGAVPVGGPGVPITLTTFGVMLCGAVLGPWRGALAASVYLVLGLAGLPVFAGGASGPGVLAGPSAGFLLAYPLAALVTGLVARAAVRRAGRTLVPGLALACALGGVVVVYAGGVPGMALNGGLSLRAAAVFCVRFLPGDLVKLVLAVLVAVPVHRAFPRLLGR